MCDTLFIRDGSARVFAKNSDRHKDEYQYLWYASDPLADCEDDSVLEYDRQYQEGPHALLLQALAGFSNPYPALVSTPSWMWGAEMGINSQRVFIGNEALFSNRRSPYRKKGLLGMDILRLALHNASDALEAVEVITHLIETFGQGGNGAYRGKLLYHNGFLIGDGQRCFILESADRTWACREVSQSTTISNCYSIRKEYQRTNGKPGTDFKALHQDRFYTYLSKGELRREATLEAVSQTEASIGAARKLCRSHLGNRSPGMGSVCIHPDRLTKSATTSSLIVELTKDRCDTSYTSTAYPCCSIYCPFPLARTEQQAEQLRQSSLPTTRAAGFSFSAREAAITRAIEAQGALKAEISDSLHYCQERIDQLLARSPASFRREIEIAEICHKERTETLDDIAQHLGVHYDERHNTATT